MMGFCVWHSEAGILPRNNFSNNSKFQSGKHRISWNNSILDPRNTSLYLRTNEDNSFTMYFMKFNSSKKGGFADGFLEGVVPKCPQILLSHFLPCSWTVSHNLSYPQCHSGLPEPPAICGLARTFPGFRFRIICLQAILMFEVLWCIQRCCLKRFLIDCLKCFKINWARCFLGILLPQLLCSTCISLSK